MHYANQKVTMHNKEVTYYLHAFDLCGVVFRQYYFNNHFYKKNIK